MAGTVYSKFFWSDWLSDPQLRMCSFAARGMWMDLLCLAAQATPTGHVKIGSRVPTTPELAQFLHAPVHIVQGLIDELIRMEVCDVGSNGVLVSRRMVRDEKNRRRNSEAGKRSAEVRGGIVGKITTGSNGCAEPQSPESRVQSPVSQPDNDVSWVQAVSDAIGFDITAEHPSKASAYVAQILELQGMGIDIKKHLVPVIVRMRAEGRVLLREFRSFRYFRDAALAERNAQGVLAGAKDVGDKALRERIKAMTREEWNPVWRLFLRRGLWVAQHHGPSPFEAGCLAPADEVTAMSVVWDAQGQHPLEAADGSPWEPARKGILDTTIYVPEQTPFFGQPKLTNVVPLRRAQ